MKTYWGSGDIAPCIFDFGIHMGHCNRFHDTSILAKKSERMENIISEAMETDLHCDMNRVGCFSLGCSG
jgi:hypothetical protein